MGGAGVVTWQLKLPPGTLSSAMGTDWHPRCSSSDPAPGKAVEVTQTPEPLHPHGTPGWFHPAPGPAPIVATI